MNLANTPNHITNATLTALTNPNHLAKAQLPTIQSAFYKMMATDFIVNETINIDFSETGEHLWLLVKKQGMNTAFVAQLLAKWANIPLKDVGYSGLKDRHALTTQWFSLRLPKKQRPEHDFYFQSQPNYHTDTDLDTTPTDIEFAQILAEHWHDKKLNRGTHKQNHFIITLRQVDGDTTQIEQQLKQIIKTGVPNYFGEQRFGHDGQNLLQAIEFFNQQPQDPLSQNLANTSTNPTHINKRKNHKKRPNKKQQEQISLLLSTARSVIFNQILSQRVQDGSWQTGLSGEVFNLNGTGSIFASEQLDDTLQHRLNIADIHPTAPLWGIGNDKVQGTAKQLEQQVIYQHPISQQLAKGLENYGVKASRRPLRLMVDNLSWTWQTPTNNPTNQDNSNQNHPNNQLPTLILDFNLPTGSFATVVLMALVAELKTNTKTISAK